MVDFRAMLRGAFGLSRAAAEPSGDRWDIRRRPRLLIISRKNSRAFLNERAMADMAMSLGYDVRVGEPDTNTEVSRFARLVNSADVMVGVHGAGLTNAVHLPPGGVLIQVVPYGNIESIARAEFSEPVTDMGLKYLDYSVSVEESSLLEKLGPDHPAIKDPDSIHRSGWTNTFEFYLAKQNVRINTTRFAPTLAQAFDHLRQQ